MTAPPPTPQQAALLERYLDELERWNRRLNLTAVPRERAWEKHVVESQALLSAAAIVDGSAVVDIGSGGGIPGVVAAVLHPLAAVTLVESDQRKAGFLVHVAGLLDLRNVAVEARRAEDLATDARHHEHYDVALSRAAAPPQRLVALALPLLRPAGALFALVTDAPSAALTLRGAAAGVVAVDAGIVAVTKVASG